MAHDFVSNLFSGNQYIDCIVHQPLAIGLTAAAVIGTAAYLYSRPRPMSLMFDLNNQSIILDEKEGIRGSRARPDGSYMDRIYDDVGTLDEAFKRGLRLSGDEACLGWRPAKGEPLIWMTYRQVRNIAHSIGSALITEMHQAARNDTFIGIFAANSREWVLLEQGCNMFSMVSVPLYDTLGTEACRHIINQTEMQVIMCDTVKHARSVLVDLGNTPHLRHIIVIEPFGDDLVRMCGDQVQLHRFQSIMELEMGKLQPPKPPKPEDLATICYTSGTTGVPKGCLLTHQNIIADLSCCLLYFNGSGVSFTAEDVHLSYLPLAHMFERSAQIFMFMHGAKIGFASGDIRELPRDMADIKPTFFCSVPRVLNRIYDKTMAAVAGSGLKSRLLRWGIEAKMNELRRGIVRKNSVWDYVVFRRIQATLGGRVKVIITGSAPLSNRVLDFCRAAFGCHVFEAYGQTECSAAVSSTVPGEHQAGHVGPPIPCNHIKLVDVPEMGISVRHDGRGEICIRGLNCTSGYFKEPQKTQELIDEQGWLHTGDIGLWMPNGTLRVVDRCKHIFKLSQGEYIAPEKIESIYLQCSMVAQVFVDGTSLHTCTVAIVVPDFERVRKRFPLGSSDADLCAGTELKQAILKEMIDYGAEQGLKGFEQVRAVYLYPESFTVDNGLLTPTLKSKRPELRRLFADKIAQLYRDLGEC